MPSNSTADDPYDLMRFVRAQSPVFESVLAELRSGEKIGHWMWFIFPQFLGLASSAMSREFAIRSLDEARAYLTHKILGPRLKQSTQLVLAIQGRSIGEIFGYPDDLKFRSSMTLFAKATADNDIFRDALQKYFAGDPDPHTLRLLETQG